MNKKNIGSGLILVGGFSIINGLGNYFVKSYNLNYLLFMLVVGSLFLGLGYFLRRKYYLKNQIS